MTKGKVESDADDTAPPVLQTYRPVDAMPYWEVLKPAVETSVALTVRRTGRSARDFNVAATAFVLWAWQTKGLDPEPTGLFTHRLVEEFSHRGMPDATRGSRATYRSALRAMVNAITPPADQTIRIPRSEPTLPYSPAEVAAMRSWAVRQGKEPRRRDALTLLALGLGAGLSTIELLAVRVADVDIRVDDLHVQVWDGRPRIVPVTAAWRQPIRDAAASGSPDDWLFRPRRRGVQPGQVTDFLHRRHDTPVDVRPVRMRTTWLLTHLTLGTPPHELLRIAGLEQLASLDRISQFLPPRAPKPRRG